MPGDVAQASVSTPVIDLFSGVGGLSLGAARAGFSVRGAIELDPHACAAHARNFPNAIHLERDATTLSGAQLRQVFGLESASAFGIVGGPPCQGFSVIGRRDRRDPRNRLFVHFFRLVREANPTFFVAENVPGILSTSNRQLLDAALSLVGNRYRIVGPVRAAANSFGAPTSRERVFFIGLRKGLLQHLNETHFAPPASAERIIVRHALSGLPSRVLPSWQSEESGWRRVRVLPRGEYEARLWGHVPHGVGDAVALMRLSDRHEVSGNLGTVHSAKVAARYRRTSHGKIDLITKSRRLDPEGFCPTLRAGTGSDRGRFQAVRPLHPSQDRVITPREAARLQGFPDWFQFSPTKWHSFRMIGNSVPPILAEGLMSEGFLAVVPRLRFGLNWL